MGMVVVVYEMFGMCVVGGVGLGLDVVDVIGDDMVCDG